MKLGRPIEFDPKTALDAAMQQFWINGYNATSLQDLLGCMQISKSTFYQCFASKENLFKKCIENYRSEMFETLDGNLKSADTGFEFIKATFYNIANEAKLGGLKNGCLVMNTAHEFAQRNDAIAYLVKESITCIENIFLKAVKRGQLERDISNTFNAAQLARYLVSNMSGLKSMVKAGVGKKQLQGTVKIILQPLRNKN